MTSARQARAAPRVGAARCPPRLRRSLAGSAHRHGRFRGFQVRDRAARSHMTTPAFRITAARKDVSGRIGDRRLSLSVTGEDGEKADRPEIEIDDRDGQVALRDTETKLQGALGYRGAGAGQPWPAQGRCRFRLQPAAVDADHGHGDPLTPPRLTGPDLTEWSGSLDTREVCGSVEAEWAQVGSGQVHRLTKGSGMPVLRLRHVHASADEASIAAEARPLFHPRRPPDHRPASHRQRFPGPRRRLPGLDHRDHALEQGGPGTGWQRILRRQGQGRPPSSHRRRLHHPLRGAGIRQGDRRGLLIEAARTNQFLNSATPASQSITVTPQAGG
jgi:hypothetical protein